MVPQVYFSTKTFSGRLVNRDYQKLVYKLNREHNWMQFIENPLDICYVEGFNEAYSKNFLHYHLHHKAGQYKSRDQLILENRYYYQPPYFLIFLPQSAHTRLHAIYNELKIQAI